MTTLSINADDRTVLRWALEEAIEGMTANGEDTTGVQAVLSRLNDTPTTVDATTEKATKHLARALQALTGRPYKECLQTVRATDDKPAKQLLEAAKDTSQHGTVTVDRTDVTTIVTTLIGDGDGYDVLHAFKDVTGARGVIMGPRDAADRWNEAFGRDTDDDGEPGDPTAWTADTWAALSTSRSWRRTLEEHALVYECMWDVIDDAVRETANNLNIADEAF